MFNKNKKAIRILKNDLEELDRVNNVAQGNTWKASLKDTLNLYIGPSSSISEHLDSLKFTKINSKTVPGALGIFTEDVYDFTKKENFRELVTKAIDHIQSNGVFKDETRSNFLSGLNNTTIISGILAGAGLLYGIGNYFGKLEKDREIFQYEKKMKIAEEENEDNKKKIDELLNGRSLLLIQKTLKK